MVANFLFSTFSHSDKVLWESTASTTIDYLPPKTDLINTNQKVLMRVQKLCFPKLTYNKHITFHAWKNLNYPVLFATAYLIYKTKCENFYLFNIYKKSEIMTNMSYKGIKYLIATISCLYSIRKS